MKNAIAIYVSNGVVVHLVCSESRAKEILMDAHLKMESAQSFISDEGIDQEMMLAVSPDLCNRVLEAKKSVGLGMRIKAALDKHGIPFDRELRAKVSDAVREVIGMNSNLGMSVG